MAADRGWQGGVAEGGEQKVFAEKTAAFGMRGKC